MNPSLRPHRTVWIVLAVAGAVAIGAVGALSNSNPPRQLGSKASPSPACGPSAVASLYAHGLRLSVAVSNTRPHLGEVVLLNVTLENLNRTNTQLRGGFGQLQIEDEQGRAVFGIAWWQSATTLSQNFYPIGESRPVYEGIWKVASNPALAPVQPGKHFLAVSHSTTDFNTSEELSLSLPPLEMTVTPSPGLSAAVMACPEPTVVTVTEPVTLTITEGPSGSPITTVTVTETVTTTVTLTSSG